MVTWIWVLIPLVAIVGGLIIEYQKNKMAMMNRSQQNENELEELRNVVESLTGRIENLEAIAASEPDDFSSAKMGNSDKGSIDLEPSIEEENKQKVSEIANKKRRNRQ